MKKTILMLLLLLSANAFAATDYLPVSNLKVGQTATVKNLVVTGIFSAPITTTGSGPCMIAKNGTGYVCSSEWSQDFSDDALGIPSGTVLPATCVANQVFNLTTGPSGQHLYLCETSNTWILQSGIYPSSLYSNLGGKWMLNSSYADSSSNGNTLLASVSAPTFTTGFKGNAGAALAFVRASNQHLSISDASTAGLNPTSSISISAWIKLTAVGGGNTYEIVSKTTPTVAGYGYDFFVDSSGHLNFRLSSNGSSYAVFAQGASVLSAGTLYSVMAVYNGTDIRIYINNVLDTNGASNPYVYSGSIYHSSSPLVIGANGNLVDHHFGGMIDDVVVWGRAISSAERAFVYGDMVDDFSFYASTYPGPGLAVSGGTNWKASGALSVGGLCYSPDGVLASCNLTSIQTTTYLGTGRTFTANDFNGAHAFITTAATHTLPATTVNLKGEIVSLGTATLLIGQNERITALTGGGSSLLNTGAGAVLGIGKYDLYSTQTGSWYINGPAVVTTGPDSLFTNNVSKYLLSTTSPTTDSSGNSYTLTLSGAVTGTAGHAGGSNLATAGWSASNYLSSTNAAFKVTGNFTIRAWIKPASIGAIQMIATRWTVPNNLSYALYVDNLNRPLCRISGDGSTYVSALAGSVTVTTGTWYDLACVYNGTDVRLYVNGVLDSGAENPTVYSSGIFSGTSTFVIGQNSGATPVNGSVDDVAIWSRSLSATEIYNLYSRGDDFK